MSIGLSLTALSCSSDSSDSSSTSDKGKNTSTSTTEPKATTPDDPATTTTSAPPISPEDITATADDYAKALVKSIDPNDTTFTVAQVTCLAPAWVEAIGVDTFKASSVTPESIADQTSSIADLTITSTMADAMVEAMVGCDVDSRQVLITSATGGTKLTSEQAACFEKAVTKEIADEALATRFAGSQPDADLLAPAQACVTAGN